MSYHDVGECDSCGATTRGAFCFRCQNRVDDASKAFAESVAMVLSEDDATVEDED